MVRFDHYLSLSSKIVTEIHLNFDIVPSLYCKEINSPEFHEKETWLRIKTVEEIGNGSGGWNRTNDLQVMSLTNSAKNPSSELKQCPCDLL